MAKRKEVVKLRRENGTCCCFTWATSSLLHRSADRHSLGKLPAFCSIFPAPWLVICDGRGLFWSWGLSCLSLILDREAPGNAHRKALSHFIWCLVIPAPKQTCALLETCALWWIPLLIKPSFLLRRSGCLWWGGICLFCFQRYFSPSDIW